MTTQMYQGLGDNARNSSRVLAPPGGASNIFFGGMDPAPAPRAAPKQQQQQPAAVLQEQNIPTAKELAANRNVSRVFGTPDKHIPKTNTAPMNPPSAMVADTANAPAHGKPKPTMNEQFELKETHNKGKARVGEHTSSRVLAPPGGRCHNIFG